MDRNNPDVAAAVAALRETSNIWVAKYRRKKALLGRASFRDIYSTLNAVSGHYISFGPTAPIPAKRKARILEEMDTALHLVCLYGYLPCVQLLLERGANLEAKDEDGAIPLRDAICWRDRDYNSRSSHKQSTHSSTISKQKGFNVKLHYKDEQSAERLSSRRATESRSDPNNIESRNEDEEVKSGKSSGKGLYCETHNEQKSLTSYKDSVPGKRQQAVYTGDGPKSGGKSRSQLNDVKDNDRRHNSETTQPGLPEKVDHNNGSGTFDSGSEGSGKYRDEKKEKSKHKRSHRHEVASDDDSSYDSEIEERKEAKRRRREEKKLRKEEKRRRREERRRRREERHAEKLKLKDHNDADSSDDEHVGRKESHRSDDEDTLSEQKKLEIELRKKAIESLKARKAISH